MCVRARVCVHACVRAYVCMGVRACVRECVSACHAKSSQILLYSTQRNVWVPHVNKK